MLRFKTAFVVITALIIGLSGCSKEKNTQTDNQLPSWNDGAAKQSIINFVNEVTDEANPNFIPAEERIATFDNDGTLWSEKPFYFQLFFYIH